MYPVTHVAIGKSDVLHGKEPLKYALAVFTSFHAASTNVLNDPN